MPLVDGNRLLVTSSYGGGSALLNMTTNPPIILWRGMNFISHYSSPVLHNGYVYGFNTFNEWLGKGSLCCLKLDTGEVQWSQPNPGWGALIYSNGKLILLDRRGELICATASPESYQEISRAHLLGGTARAEPVLSNHRLYIKNVAGDLLCLDLNPLTPQPR
jgi:outer membrane protein assembly factor BamB